MSRDVCGICWCPYENGRCGCEPVKVIDPAADEALLKQALEALKYYRSGEDYQPTPASEAIAALEERLK